MTGLSARTLLYRTVVAFSVVTLNFSRQFALLFDESNRFFLHWGLAQGLELFGVVVFLSLLAVGLSVLVDAVNSRQATMVFHHVFVLSLVSGLLAAHDFSPRPNDILLILWLCLLAVVAFSLRYPGLRLVRLSRTVAVILSPLGVVFLIQMFLFSTWNADPLPRTTFPQSRSAERGNPTALKSTYPIFFFVFDAWSFRMSTVNGEFEPYFDNLRRVTSRAFVFRQAQSPGSNTRRSLPRILYQQQIPGASFTAEDDILRSWFRRRRASSGNRSSLFDRAHRHGYSTGLIGFYFPYPRIFEHELDYYYSTSMGTEGKDFGSKVLKAVVYNLRYLNDPISQRIDRSLIRRLHSRNQFEWGNTLVDETLWFLERSTSSTFAFFHMPFPHWPYVFNPDGSYFGHEGRDYRGPRDERGYQRGLQHLDGVIGKIVDQLQSAGWFENSLLILTADHASSFESQEARIHVPLIIKLPGQQRSHVIDAPIRNNQLAPIIEAAMEGEVDEATVEKTIKGFVATLASGAAGSLKRS